MLLFSIRNLIRNIVNKYLVVNVGKEILSHHFYKHIPHCHPFIFSIPGNKIRRNQKNIRMTGFRKSPFLKLLYGWKKRAFHQGDIWLEFKEVETQMMLLLPKTWFSHTYVYSIYHSSEIRALCLYKCFIETLQNVLYTYFLNKKSCYK